MKINCKGIIIALGAIIVIMLAACSNPAGDAGDDLPITVAFNSVTQNGSLSATTTELFLSFSQAIPGLEAVDIALDGVPGVQKGSLSGAGPDYTLPISGFSTGGSLSVSVSKEGFAIDGSPRTVTIYYNIPVIPLITITGQPVPAMNVTEGSITSSLNITAVVTEGAELSYQWYSNTLNSNKDGASISGAVSPSFTIPATLTVGTYYYFCEVTAPKAETVRSNVTAVNVLDIPTLNLDDFLVSDNIKTYNGSPQNASVCFYGTNINTTTAGDIFVSYSGKDGTVYVENAVGPINAGSYIIFVYTNGGTIYAPFEKTSVGILTINKTSGFFLPVSPIDTVYTPILKLANVTLPGNYEWRYPQTQITNAGDGQSFEAIYNDPSGNFLPAIGTVTVNVAQAQGTDVSVPTLNTKTHNSITINPVFLPYNGQNVEYGISTSNTILPSAWQSTLSFNNLDPGTDYYIRSRSAESNNYKAGAASEYLAVTTLQTVSENRFEYYWVNEKDTLVTTSGGATTINSGTTLIFTSEGSGYSSWQWYVNGINTGQTGSSYTFSSMITGKHTVGLFVVKNNKLYNANIIITVQ